MTDRIAQLKKLLDTDPGDPFCLYSLAFEHQKLGQNDAAVAYYDRTLAADPDYFYAYFQKAKIQQATGDVKSARSTLVEGLRRAEAKGDAKASSEIQKYLEELS